jgi:hypothetical protein
MSSLAAISLVTAAAVGARGALQALSGGTSFADMLSVGPAEASADGAEGANPAAAIPLADRERSWQAALDSFRTQLGQKLAAAGVNLNEPIEIQDDGLGGLQLGGNLADRDLIEQTLSGDAGLAAQFQSLAKSYADLHPEFDPHQTDFGVLLSGDELQVSLAAD